MKNLVLVCAAAAVLLSAGCASKNRLIGSWSVSGGNVPGAGTATFTEDKKVTIDVTNPQGSLKIAGTYELKNDDMLDMNIDSVKIDAPNLPEPMKAQVAQAEKQILDQGNKEPDQKIEWKDDDNFTLKGSEGASATFTRKKD